MDETAAAGARARSRTWTIPNVLSFLRLASVPVFLVLFLNERENAAVIVYGIGAWTDFFDGYIARRTGSVTELGKLLDPLADRIFIVALAVALVARGTLELWLAAVIVGRDVLVLCAFPLLERRGVPRIPVSFLGKFATASLLSGLTWLAWSETTFPASGTVAERIGVAFTVVGAVVYWVATFFYAREAMEALRSTSRIEGRSG